MTLLRRIIACLRPAEGTRSASAQERMEILMRIKFPCC